MRIKQLLIAATIILAMTLPSAAEALSVQVTQNGNEYQASVTDGEVDGRYLLIFLNGDVALDQLPYVDLSDNIAYIAQIRADAAQFVFGGILPKAFERMTVLLVDESGQQAQGSVSCSLPGDINGDSLWTDADFDLLLSILSGCSLLQDGQTVVADVDGSGSLDVLDAITLRDAVRQE